MKTIKQVRREAKHLFRLCLVNGSLDEGRVRQVVQSVLAIQTPWLPGSCRSIRTTGETRAVAAHGQGRERRAVVPGLASECPGEFGSSIRSRN